MNSPRSSNSRKPQTSHTKGVGMCLLLLHKIFDLDAELQAEE